MESENNWQGPYGGEGLRYEWPRDKDKIYAIMAIAVDNYSGIKILPDKLRQTEFYEILHELQQRMAIVLVSHDISAVSVHVEKIACLNQQLFHHGSGEIEAEVLEATYKCPIQMITHGEVPHRVLREH